MPEPFHPLKVEHEATFLGPNPLSANPVIVASISTPGSGLASADAWTEGCRVLHEHFPEWVDAPDPSVQHPLTLAGRTAARWALAVLNEAQGYLHDAGAVPLGADARVWLGFHRPEVSFLVLKMALDMLAHAAGSGEIDRSRAASVIDSVWQLCRPYHPDFQAHFMMQGARARNVPVLPFITGTMFWQHGWGCHSRLFVETSSNNDGYLAGTLADSKVLSKMAFAQLGFPTPEHRLVTRADELPEAIKAVGWPCVVKPLSQRAGRGVTAGVRTQSEAEAAFVIAKRYSDGAIMVEAFVPGDDHRLMVIDGRFSAAVRREPPSVTGDGNSTVAELIATLNSGRSRNKAKTGYLSPVVVDDIVEQHLERQGVSIRTVLDARRRVTLRGNANRSTGGAAFDVTDKVHPHTGQMAEAIARGIGLSAAGFDFVTPDITKPWHECGALIEVNVSPGTAVLTAAGLDGISVASAILGVKPARIPVQLVVAPQPELPQLLDQLRSAPAAEGFGWVCGREAAVGGIPLRVTLSAPWGAVQTLLRHSSLQRACLVCSVDQLMRHGMPVDKADCTALYRCGGAPLPSAWIKVLRDRSGTISACSDWTHLRLPDFATATLSSA